MNKSFDFLVKGERQNKYPKHVEYNQLIAVLEI